MHAKSRYPKNISKNAFSWNCQHSEYSVLQMLWPIDTAQYISQGELWIWCDNKSIWKKMIISFLRTSELIFVQDTNQSGAGICIYIEFTFSCFFPPLSSSFHFYSPLWRIKHNGKKKKSSAWIILSLFQTISDSVEPWLLQDFSNGRFSDAI